MGFWGSNNSMEVMAAGGAGIVTDGYCRHSEVTLQKTPICAARAHHHPRRIMTVEVEAPVGCGGAHVRPGDMVGCDDDGVIVVPQEIAEEAAIHARAILLADMKDRANLYRKLGLPADDTVNVEMVEAYYAAL